MQDAVEQLKTDKKGEGRGLFSGRNIAIGVGILLAILIVYGIIDEATAEASPFGPQQSFLVLATLSFLGGVLSFLSPCTLPILPAYFAFATKSSRSQIAVNTFAFILGLATVFALFGASASALGSLMRQNQDLILLIGGGLIVVFGAMSLLGKGFTGVSAANDAGGAGGDDSSGLGGSFVFGMTFAAGWSSCIGPILGIMLTLAATTASVSRGIILLFIFALGLGLPLLLVSTFIGRASRQSLIWRILRGKGWFVNVQQIAIAAVWAVAVWLILIGIANYLTFNFNLLPELSGIQMVGLLLLTLIGAAVYAFTLGGNERTELHLHTTSLFSGVLFLVMGWFMLSGELSQITAAVNQLTAESEWFVRLEEGLYGLFQ